jgi:hypothetical protein
MRRPISRMVSIMHSSQGQAPDAPSRWRPTRHERYYLILGDGSIQQLPWNDTDFDHRAWQFGNCFRRRTAAEQARKSVHEVLRSFQ